MNNNDYIYWNIYISVESMTKLERDFYVKLYNYRFFCREKEQANNLSYRDTLEYKKILNSLNFAYEKAFDLRGADKNEFGEYEYPKVAYKAKRVNVNGTSKTILYACVADTETNRKFPIEEVIPCLYLYSLGTVRNIKASNSEFECVLIESTVSSIISLFKQHHKELGRFCALQSCIDIVQWLDKYPLNSISELNLNSLVSRTEVDSCLKDFNDIIINKEAV